MLDRVRENVVTIETDKQEGWTTTGLNELEYKQMAAFENNSIWYLPKHLPLFKSVVKDSSITKFIIPITVSIKIKQIGNQGYKNTRLLVAMSKVFQVAFQDSYIASTNYFEDNQQILHHTQIPLDQQALRKFMSKTEHGTNNIHSTKIILHTNHELKDYLTNLDFREYLSSESIHIEYNGLDSKIPHNVGFIEQITSSRDTTILHAERLR
jgi:hypothetical protein